MAKTYPLKNELKSFKEQIYFNLNSGICNKRNVLKFWNFLDFLFKNWNCFTKPEARAANSKASKTFMLNDYKMFYFLISSNVLFSSLSQTMFAIGYLTPHSAFIIYNHCIYSTTFLLPIYVNTKILQMTVF